MTLAHRDLRELLSNAARRDEGRRVLMCSPEHFEVAYAINPHMTGQDGALHVVDRGLASRQWAALKRTYESIGLPVDVLPGVAGLPDMVFAANQTFPFRTADGRPAVLLSNMHHPERRGEVEPFARWFKARGAEIRSLPVEKVGSFEGQGDLLWHPGRRVLYGGHGFRTTEAALDAIAAEVECPLVPLELTDARFYHLDTCLVPLDARRALAVREAFSAASWRTIESCFDRVLSPPLAESCEFLACNAHVPDGRHVLVDAGARATIRLLADEGFTVKPVDTSEFLKSGGSVFCLKMMID